MAPPRERTEEASTIYYGIHNADEKEQQEKKIADGSLFFFSFLQRDKRRKRNGRRKRFPRFLRTEEKWNFRDKKAFLKSLVSGVLLRSPQGSDSLKKPLSLLNERLQTRKVNGMPLASSTA